MAESAKRGQREYLISGNWKMHNNQYEAIEMMQ